MASDKFFGLRKQVAFKYFFDRERVIQRTSSKTRRAMSFVGAVTMRQARQSVKRSSTRTLHSPPGKPVRTPTGIYKKTILFEFDSRKEKLIVGPKQLPINSNIKPTNRQSVPQLLEYGGTAKNTKTTYMRVRPRRAKQRKKQKIVWRKIPKGTAMKYEPRPTMRLAWKKVLTKPKLQRAFGVIGFNTRT